MRVYIECPLEYQHACDACLGAVIAFYTQCADFITNIALTGTFFDDGECVLYVVRLVIP